MFDRQREQRVARAAAEVRLSGARRVPRPPGVREREALAPMRARAVAGDDRRRVLAPAVRERDARVGRRAVAVALRGAQPARREDRHRDVGGWRRRPRTAATAPRRYGVEVDVAAAAAAAGAAVRRRALASEQQRAAVGCPHRN